MSSPEAESAEVALEIDLDAAPEQAATESAPQSVTGPVAGSATAPEAVSTTPTPATDDALLRRTLEGLLFITDRPLSAAELCKLVGIRDQEKIIGTVEELRRDLEALNAGYRLIAVAEGWQMSTRPELAPYLRKLFADRATMRLSTAAQETLSIIAYKQPLTRAEIEEIRGVEVIAALETLLEKSLTKVVGRRETVGRPLMYGTTSEFLRHFGLRSLEDLPPIDSFAPAEDAAPAAAPADAAAAPPLPTEQPSAEFSVPAVETVVEAGDPAVEAAIKAAAEAAAPVAEEQAAHESAAETSVEHAASPAEDLALEAPPKPSEEDGDGSLWPK